MCRPDCPCLPSICRVLDRSVVECDEELVGTLREERRGLTTDDPSMLQVAAAIRAHEDVSAKVDDEQPVRSGPREQSGELPHTLPAPAAIARLVQTLTEIARTGRYQVQVVLRIGGQIEEGSRSLDFFPRSTGVRTYEQPVVRGVVAVHALPGSAEDVEIGIAEKRDRLPTSTLVGGLDKTE